MIGRFKGELGDLLFLVADAEKIGHVGPRWPRPQPLGQGTATVDPSNLQAAWVLDFPLVTYNEEEKRWDAEHHPFCYPLKEDVPYLDSDPGRVRAPGSW